MRSCAAALATVGARFRLLRDCQREGGSRVREGGSEGGRKMRQIRRMRRIGRMKCVGEWGCWGAFIGSGREKWGAAHSSLGCQHRINRPPGRSCTRTAAALLAARQPL